MLSIENSIELNLKDLEERVKEHSILELKEIEKNYRKKLKYLQGMLNYYKKQQNPDLDFIRFQIKEVKKAMAIIGEEKRKREKAKNCFETDETSITKKENLLHLKELMQSDLSKEEKTNKLEEMILTLKNTIEVYIEQNLELQDRKKEYLEFWTDYKTCRKCEQEIKENKLKISLLKQDIQKCRTCLIALKDVQTQIVHTKHPIVKVEKGNQYYFFILKILLKNDQNYFFIRALLSEISYFQKALLENMEKFTEEEKEYINKIKNDSQFVEEEKQENTSFTILDLEILKTFMMDTLKQKKRVNLTKNYLENLNRNRSQYIEEYFKIHETIPKEDEIKEELNCSSYDISNCRYISDTFIIENQKYAFSYGYDKDFNTFFRIHVLDTSFILEDSVWYKKLEVNPLEAKRELKKYFQFKNTARRGIYPSFTYQFKISPNGLVDSFKMFESTIEINREITNVELRDYRSEEEIKFFIRSIKFLMQEYEIDEPYLDSKGIEKMIDKLLNIELKNYLEKHKIPALYFTELEKSVEEKQKEHVQLVYYLGKIPKKEAKHFIRILENTKSSRFYSTTPLEESSIFLDTFTFIGYQQLLTLKAHFNNRDTSYYASIFTKYMECLNQTNSYIDSKTQFLLERKKNFSSK